jgi:hypothetical protein
MFLKAFDGSLKFRARDVQVSGKFIGRDSEVPSTAGQNENHCISESFSVHIFEGMPMDLLSFAGH